jgi:integrase
MTQSNRITLTARTVAGATAKTGQRLIIRDVGKGSVKGLELRVTPDGSKTWSVRYYRAADGKRRRFTFGRYPEMSLEAARQECLAVLADVRQGHDPAHARDLRRGANTFKTLAEEYLKRYASKRRSYGEIKRILEREWFPEIGDMRAGEVPRSKIIDVIDRIYDRGAPVGANRALAVLRQVYRWALSKAKLESIPVVGLKAVHRERPRDRALTTEEIRRLWQGLPMARMADELKDVVRLALILGQRVGEISGMTANEIDRDNKRWILPAERVKNGLPHSVPLSDLALSILNPRLEQRGKYLFPGRYNQDIPVLASAPNKALQRNLKLLGVQHFTIHDIRRTVNSRMAALGLSAELRSRILNHVSGRRASITESVYNVHQYEDEKRAALNTWANELQNIIGRQDHAVNVVSLPTRLEK